MSAEDNEGAPAENPPPGEEVHIHAPFEARARALSEPMFDFIQAQSSSAWLLLSATAFAVIAANSPLQHWYHELIHTDIGFVVNGNVAALSLKHWVNDGLMAIFFFLLGLELKREVMVGQLKEISDAASVICAAIGGMVVPALLFLLIADSPASQAGWAIPVATDTAFALMILVLLADKVPAAARAFLVGLAIVDDIGAITIIAVAYTDTLNSQWLIPAGLTLAALAVMNRVGIRHGFPYFIAGVILWAEFLMLGLHGTLAGVLVALSAPVRPALSRPAFSQRLRKQTKRFNRAQEASAKDIFEHPEQQLIAEKISKSATRASAPLVRWEHRLEKPVSFLIMPIFAFMNAGFTLPGSDQGLFFATDLGLAILIGLVLGKPVGIVLGVLIGQLIGVASKPAGLSWQQVIGLGLLGGIGFTMSLFIATLSFATEPMLLDIAKQSIVLTSLLTGLLAYFWLRFNAHQTP